MPSDLPDWTRRTAPRTVLAVPGQIAILRPIPSNVALMAGVAGQRIGIVSLTLRPSYSGDGSTMPRDWATVWLLDDTTATILAAGAISPETPFAYVPVAEGAGLTAVGNGVLIGGVTAHGIGVIEVAADIAYYLEG